jgi:hypothetical protein
MLIRRIALVALTLALGSTQAKASITGMELHRLCSGPKLAGLDGVQCVSYMLGFLDALGAADGLHGLLDKAQKVFCLPPDLTVGQAVLITNKFMREHPEDLHRSASMIIGKALYNVYACKRSDGAG